jgi:hypothetical protein
MIKKIYLFIIFLLFSVGIMYSQYYSTGQEPFSVQWKQINTENFQIIFPQEYAFEANKIANILQSSILRVGSSLNHIPEPISVVIHSNTASANGLVAWVPKRMELYPTIDHNAEPGNWLKHLAIHESRHVVQIDKLNQGITKILYYLFGEQASGLVLGLYMPLWFLEGDAVGAETTLTESGRGRMASFSQSLKPIILEKQNYSFDKASFGSYKDYVPNHYKFGYNFTSYLRTKYGSNIWDTVINNVAKRPYSITPFNNALKSITGKNKTALFQDFKDSLYQAYSIDNKVLNDRNPNYYKEIFVNYNSPIMVGNSVIAVKSSLENITSFVDINNEAEKKIFTPGYINDFRIRGNEQFIVWTEQFPDTRWQNKDYSIVKLLNLETNQVKLIGNKSRFYSPDIYYDTLSIVELGNEYSVILWYSIHNESFIDTIKIDNLHFIEPQIINPNQILTIVHEDDGQSIVIIDIKTQKIRYLTDKTFFEIKDPVLIDSTLFYINGENGVNNIYSINIETKERKQITNAAYGIDGLFYNNGNFIYSDYTSSGYKIKTLHIDKAFKQNIVSKNKSFLFADSLTSQEGGIIKNTDITNKKFKINKYSRLASLFNIHSWGLLYYNIDDYTFNPGITFLGQNILNTSFLTLSYEKDLSREADIYRFDWSYKGFYPTVDNAITYSKFDSYFLSHDDSILQFPVNQTSYDLDVSIPLNLTKNKFLRYIQPKIGHSFINRNVDHIWKDSVFTGTVSSFNYTFYGIYKLKKAHQHIYSRIGFELLYKFKHTPITENNLGSIVSLENKFYIPGILNDHHIILNANYQRKDRENYMYADIQNIARGYINSMNDEMFNYSANYTFPILYPDFSLSSISYIKRIYANVFFDYSETLYIGKLNFYNSYGLDILSDMHLLRTVIPVKLGLRTIYLHNTEKIRFEFLFKLDLSNI